MLIFERSFVKRKMKLLTMSSQASQEYSPCIMCVEYIGGCSLHRGDTMSTSGGYHEYIGGCSVHQRDTMSTSGDVQYIREIP